MDAFKVQHIVLYSVVVSKLNVNNSENLFLEYNFANGLAEIRLQLSIVDFYILRFILIFTNLPFLKNELWYCSF